MLLSRHDFERQIRICYTSHSGIWRRAISRALTYIWQASPYREIGHMPDRAEQEELRGWIIYMHRCWWLWATAFPPILTFQSTEYTLNLTTTKLDVTEVPAYSDTLGTWKKCHSKQIVTVTRGNLLTNQSFGTCQKCHCKQCHCKRGNLYDIWAEGKQDWFKMVTALEPFQFPSIDAVRELRAISLTSTYSQIDAQFSTSSLQIGCI